MFSLFRHFQLFYTAAAAAAETWASCLALAAKVQVTESHLLFTVVTRGSIQLPK